MSQANRELTAREKQRIKKLIVSKCASYDKEYGCLLLDCECPISVSAIRTAHYAHGSVMLYCQMHRSCKPYLNHSR